MLAWIDLETTGLSPVENEVIEVACIVTDDALNEVARFHRVVYTGVPFASLNSAVQDMHLANGLWREVQSKDAYFRWTVDDELQAFLHEHAPGATLAGSTISFDREFMRHHLPRSLDQVHYRSLDVTSLNEMARRFWPGVYNSRPANAEKAHRAMPDIEESLRIARHYAGTLGTV